MIKKNKNLKKIYLIKKFELKNKETKIIKKSVKNNLKIKNVNRVFFFKKKKKKLSSNWLNSCFFLGLMKKQLKKLLMSRFALKNKNLQNQVTNIKIKSW